MTGATTPKLRFPGLREPWKPTAVSTLLEKQSVPVDVDLAQTYRQIGVRSHGKGIFHKDAVTGAELGDKRVFHIVPNAFVVNIVFAWEQAVALTSDAEAGFIASHRFPMFTEKSGKSYLPFLRHMFLTKRGKLLLEIASPGGAGRNKTLGQQEFLKLKPVVPGRAEQKKIADAVDAVDAKLAALAAKQAALGRFKAGLMQKLFSQQLRFTQDDGKAFPDWQEIELRSVSTINPKSPKLPNRFRYIDLESVNAGTLGAVGEIEATEAPSRAQRVLQRGDILYQMVRPYQRNNLYFELDGVYVGSTGYAQIRARQNRQYLFHVLHTDEFVNRVLERCTGTGYPAINSNDLGKVTVPFPHPDEQQKIANALSAMDAKIQAVAGQITKLQTFKKGLLQQMFV